MTLEEMIELLTLDEEARKGVGPDHTAKFDAIVAALKAGQDLSAAAQEVLDVDLYGGYERRLREAVKAWDAATRGEDE